MALILSLVNNILRLRFECIIKILRNDIRCTFQKLSTVSTLNKREINIFKATIMIAKYYKG